MHRGLRAAALHGGLGPDPARLPRGGTPKLIVMPNRSTGQIEDEKWQPASIRETTIASEPIRDAHESSDDR